jgi:hypothetical protein
VAEAVSVTAQGSPKVEDLMGTWELVSTKNAKTGVVTQSPRKTWMFITRSHWAVFGMSPGRKVIPQAEYDKLSPEGKIKADYSRVWDDKGEQVYLSRTGTYTLKGDRFHHPVVMATYTQLIGVDRVLRIIKLDKNNLVVVTEFPDQPTNTGNEQTYRRLD